jgi:phage shock protein PspC (stress-responsive transcriptional regulator)
VAGICAGIGGYSGLDVILVRVIVTALAVITGGTGALACLAPWMIIPGEGEKTSIAQDILGQNQNARSGRPPHDPRPKGTWTWTQPTQSAGCQW